VLKVYLSVPMIANRSLDRAKMLAKAIEDSGNEMSSPWVLGQIEKSSSPVNVFERDRIGSETCDVLVADVTEPSIGVGMEIMAAYKAGRRVVLIVKKGNVTSRMLQHMNGKETLEYDQDPEVYRGLKRLLEKMA
jgi:2'-deoxynucleoside 5'-phosphate N-hydrolase